MAIDSIPQWLLDTRNQIADVRAWLAEVEAKLDTAEAAAKQPVRVPTAPVDEEVAAATSVTQVHKALERELGIDRRTVLTKVERVVRAHGIDAKIPDWSTNVRLAKYLAERQPSGNARLVEALLALKGGAA